MSDIESIILRQVLKRASTPLTPEQILNEVREMGYPRVKAREVDKILEAASNSDSSHKIQVPQREALGWALTESYKRKLGQGRPPSPQPKRGAPGPEATSNPSPGAHKPATLPVFGDIEPVRLIAQDELFVVVQDKFPVSPGHTLIIARRPAARFQDLTTDEKARLLVWIDWAQRQLATRFTPAPDGFNLGLNDGPAAGQTMSQFHFHVIPRYAGDVADPRGGIRHAIGAKARSWEEAPGTTSPA